MRTNVLVRDLDLVVTDHLDGRRKLSPTACLCSAGSSSPWTQLLCQHCAETACPAEERIGMQVWHCGKYALLNSSASAGADGDTPTAQQVLRDSRERHAAWGAKLFSDMLMWICVDR